MLRQMREDANLNQATLGQRLDRSQSAISKAELGETGLSVEDIGSWATTCGRQISLRLGEGVDTAGEDVDGLDALPTAERVLLTRIVRALGSAGAAKPLVLGQLELIAEGVERQQAGALVDRVFARVAEGTAARPQKSGGAA